MMEISIVKDSPKLSLFYLVSGKIVQLMKLNGFERKDVMKPALLKASKAKHY